MIDLSDHTMDNIKITTSIAPAALTFAGMSLQNWVYITSIIVALMVIIEKAPIVIDRVKSIIKWFKD